MRQDIVTRVWVVYHYHLERPPYGEGMDGKPPFRVLGNLGYDLLQEFALFLPLVLDRISADWALRGGNDLLAHYNVADSRDRWFPGYGRRRRSAGER